MAQTMAQTMSDREHEPDIKEILSFVGESAAAHWTNVTEFLGNACRAKSKTEYSVCSMQRGWNVKYKKSGKALCTLYPEAGRVRALVTLGANESEYVYQNRDLFGEGFLASYDESKPMMGLRWLMLDLDADIAEDIKRIAAVKAGVDQT